MKHGMRKIQFHCANQKCKALRSNCIEACPECGEENFAVGASDRIEENALVCSPL